MAAFRFEQPERILQAIAEGCRQGLALRLAGHDSAALAGGVGQVACLRADVEVAQHAERIPLLVLHRQIALQAGQPFEFVGVLLAAERAAVGHVEVEHPHAVHQGADHPLLLAQANGVGITWQQRLEADLHILQRQAAEDRHAVVGLLAADAAGVTEGGEGLGGEEVVADLGFLQAEHLRLLLLQPGEHLLQARAHRVHVPAGDAHGPPAPAGMVPHDRPMRRLAWGRRVPTRSHGPC